MLRGRHCIFLAAAVAAAAFAASPAYAGEYHSLVEIETVNAYSPCGIGPDLSNSNSSGSAFWNQLSSQNADGFGLTAHYQDGMVWDTDFLDPDTAGANRYDNDTSNFDGYDWAISFYQGHGLGSIKPTPDQVCTSEYQCTAPPGGASVGNTGYGACVKSPGSYSAYGSGEGVCQYTSTRSLVVCGSDDQNGHVVPLSPNMALGENATNGGWRGAGTNGGTSLAILKMSFGMLTFFPSSEWAGVFAGVHLYGSTMISWGDSEDSPGFGNAVASPYTANPNSSVVSGYVNAISSVTDGGGCNGSVGGGFNGCGCHAMMTISSSSSGAYSTFNENWAALKSDQASQNGSGYWYWSIGCNYNPATYPWTGGDHT